MSICVILGVKLHVRWPKRALDYSQNMISHLNIYIEWGDLRSDALLQANSIKTPPLPLAMNGYNGRLLLFSFLRRFFFLFFSPFLSVYFFVAVFTSVNTISS